jgi:hypothetical protein
MFLLSLVRPHARHQRLRGYACLREREVAHTPACHQDGVVSETHRLRDKAAHVREVAKALTDRPARAALRDLADDLERQASELEREQHKQGMQENPASDTR